MSKQVEAVLQMANMGLQEVAVVTQLLTDRSQAAESWLEANKTIPTTPDVIHAKELAGKRITAINESLMKILSL